MVQAANGAVKKKYSFYEAKYKKLTIQTGSRNKAKVAIANKIARVIYKMITDSTCDKFIDPGPVKAVNPQKKIKNLIQQLQRLGVDVEHHTKEKIVTKSEHTIGV